MKRSSLTTMAAFALAFSPLALATSITGITPDAHRVALVNGKATVTFLVSGQGNDGDCGMWIEYGDNGSPDTRIVGRNDGFLPREFEHTFGAAGQFTITARGQRVKQTAACDGAKSTTVTVVAERPGRRRAVAQSCPDGWRLQEGSFDRETGAFSCAPAYPVQRIDCGPGLRYFESEQLIGCRTRGRGRDER